MRVEDIVSPGPIPSGQALRQEVVKALNYLTVVSDQTGSSIHAAGLADFLTAAAARATAFVRVATTGVAVTPATSSGAVGSTVQLTAAIAPAGTTGKKVTWVSADPTKVIVDARGLVTRLATGVVVVSAISNDDPTKLGTTTITVV